MGHGVGSPTKQSSTRWMVLLVSAGVLLGGAYAFLWALVPRPIRLPLAAVVVSPDLRPTDSLAASPGDQRGHDLVLITLDTTRPDRLGCYGNAEIETPRLDRLAEEGVIFSSAVATSPTTLPSHASILTGLYPLRHGARANSVYRLGDERLTLAEMLSGAGYETGAFVSAFVLDERFGLAQGFDVYDARVNRLSASTGYAERRADKTTDRAIRWLRRRGPEPYFLWVHYYDPHAINEPPSPYDRRYSVPYDGEIAFVDHELGRLLDVIDGMERDRLVVVVGDHGEAFGEHGEHTHGYLLQEATLRIPLILNASRGLPRGRHVAGRVSQVDLVPTILDLLGIEGPGDLDGASLLDPPTDDRMVFAEAVEGRSQFGWARLSAGYRGALKYVDGPSPEFYDLARDPLERKDVSGDRESDAAALRRRVRSHDGEEARRLEAASVALDAEAIRRLEALGYVVGDGQPDDVEAEGPDPKAMVPLLTEMQEILGDYENPGAVPRVLRPLLPLLGKHAIRGREDLLLELERIASAHPEFAPVHEQLAKFYREEKRLEDAAKAERRFKTLKRGR